MTKEAKLYAIFKAGKHIGNQGASTPKKAIYFYCRVAKLPICYETYKAKKAIAGKHYQGQENLWKTEIF